MRHKVGLATFLVGLAAILAVLVGPGANAFAHEPVEQPAVSHCITAPCEMPAVAAMEPTDTGDGTTYAVQVVQLTAQPVKDTQDEDAS